MNAINARDSIQNILGVAPDGVIGVDTMNALNTLILSTGVQSLAERIQIQEILNVTADGVIGPVSLTQLHILAQTPDAENWPLPVVWHSVIASDFADPSDLAAYKKAIADGKTQEEAFAVGDNCVGCWGDFTGDVNGVPMCALPPEIWKPFGTAARGKGVIVLTDGISVQGELRDTMPHLTDIKNGAGIDLNPAFLKQLGLTAPIMKAAQWRWV